MREAKSVEVRNYLWFMRVSMCAFVECVSPSAFLYAWLRLRVVNVFLISHISMLEVLLNTYFFH